MHDTRNRRCKDEIERPPATVDMNDNDNINDRSKMSFRDKQSIGVLTFLYILQGIPLGLAGSVPLILQSRQVSYSTQATFSFVFWPFSLKILWAPIVDSLYVDRFGRRKSWLVPTQYLIGLTMMFVSFNVERWLSGDIDVASLTCAFCLLNFLAATQDIAVDGWALTMLSKDSVGWASTCNSVGQTVGYFIAFIVFLALESAEFCNSWLRSEPAATGVVTFQGFLHFWGIVFMVATTLVAILQREDSSNSHSNGGGVPVVAMAARGDNRDLNRGKDHDQQQEVHLGLADTYRTLWSIIKLRPIYIYVLSLMFIKLGFSAADSVTGLKLIEKGVSKEKMAFIGSLIVPVQIMITLAVSRHTTGDRPLDIFIKAALPRMLYGPVFCLLVYATPLFQDSDGSYSYVYYIVLTVIYSSHQIFVYPMFVSQMAFYARISDPAVGGTYMTLLNTVTNLAFNIPSTIMLYLVDHITVKQCRGGPNDGTFCSSRSDALNCTQSSPAGVCETTFDGYYLEVLVSTAIGVLALLARRPFLYQLQRLPLDSWRIFKR